MNSCISTVHYNCLEKRVVLECGATLFTVTYINALGSFQVNFYLLPIKMSLALITNTER